MTKSLIGDLQPVLFETRSIILMLYFSLQKKKKKQVGIILKVTTTPFPHIVRHKEEESFVDSVTDERQRFPSLEDPPTLELSVIVPAFDEEKRRKLN